MSEVHVAYVDEGIYIIFTSVAQYLLRLKDIAFISEVRWLMNKCTSSLQVKHIAFMTEDTLSLQVKHILHIVFTSEANITQCSPCFECLYYKFNKELPLSAKQISWENTRSSGSHRKGSLDVINMSISRLSFWRVADCRVLKQQDTNSRVMCVCVGGGRGG